jgi:hypothetical protein
MSHKIKKRPKPMSDCMSIKEIEQFNAAYAVFAARYGMKSGGGFNFGRIGARPEREER